MVGSELALLLKIQAFSIHQHGYHLNPDLANMRLLRQFVHRNDYYCKQD